MSSAVNDHSKVLIITIQSLLSPCRHHAESSRYAQPHEKPSRYGDCRAAASKPSPGLNACFVLHYWMNAVKRSMHHMILPAVWMPSEALDNTGNPNLRPLHAEFRLPQIREQNQVRMTDKLLPIYILTGAHLLGVAEGYLCASQVCQPPTYCSQFSLIPAAAD